MALSTLLSTSISRLGSAAQNALEVARFGGLETGERPAPFDVTHRRDVYRLRHYFPRDQNPGPSVLLVPPLMMAADLFDISPTTSAVRALNARGIDPWVVDFGAPEREEAGYERTFTDHVLAVADAIGRIRASTGKDIHLAGYCQGGVFCYQAAAYCRGEGVASVVSFGSPIDLQRAFPAVPQRLIEGGAALMASVAGRTNVPAAVARVGFRLINPVKTIRNEIDFLLQLHNREALIPREAQRRFLNNDGWVGWSGPAVAELMSQFLATNRMLQGGFVIDERVVTLADLALPVLCVIGEMDKIGRAPAIRAIPEAMPRATLYELSLPVGHFGLVVGRHAEHTTWPTVAKWIHWCESGGEGTPPVEPISGAGSGRASPADVDRVVSAAADAGIDLVRWFGATSRRAAYDVRLRVEELAEQLPRLARLERVRPSTEISLGRLLAQRTAQSGNDVFLLFEDRAVTYSAVNGRIDAVVRGLIEIGIRRGEHIGVLMDSRPTGFSIVAALNRLGAVAVLMRPDGDVKREATLGQVTIVVAAPQLAKHALDAGLQVHVLGGGSRPREVDPQVRDMEEIDPAAVVLPAWYRPDPGCARDVAFIMFTGEGQMTRRTRITNGRWALSAYGTASAAALRHTDTVYAVTPIFHPSGLLMTVGGAIAAGARIALARSFDAETFWEEVRRYGVTVSSYTWTMLAEIVNAPYSSAEHYHPIRLLMGSGMPRGLWRRVTQRLAPARVLEFYAATEGTAVLANLSSSKPGCKGRPLPGSSELRIAAYDFEKQRLIEGVDGYAVECGVDEIGMLLSRVSDDRAVIELPRRNLFGQDDAWQITGDLFRRDGDGDYWLIGDAAALIRTEHGCVPRLVVEDALGDIEAVDLAVVYGVVDEAQPERSRCVAAATVRAGETLRAGALTRALSKLPTEQWPEAVQVVDCIPVTTAYRPSAEALRAIGFPKSGERVWFRRGTSYRRG